MTLTVYLLLCYDSVFADGLELSHLAEGDKRISSCVLEESISLNILNHTGSENQIKKVILLEERFQCRRTITIDRLLSAQY